MEPTLPKWGRTNGLRRCLQGPPKSVYVRIWTVVLQSSHRDHIDRKVRDLGSPRFISPSDRPPAYQRPYHTTHDNKIRSCPLGRVIPLTGPFAIRCPSRAPWVYFGDGEPYFGQSDADAGAFTYFGLKRPQKHRSILSTPMGPSTKTSFTKKFPLRLRHLVPGHHTIQGFLDDTEERERLVGGGSSVKTTVYCQSPPTQLQIVGSPTPKVDAAALLQRYVQMAQDLQPSLPSTCRRVNRDDLKLISKQPTAAGSFADILEATYNGRGVVLKAYRCYVSFDVAQIVAVRPATTDTGQCSADTSQRFENEVLVWTFLHDKGLDVVPLVGVYSTEARPFGLVYETMDGLDLRQHLRNNPHVGKLNLVFTSSQAISRTSTL